MEASAVSAPQVFRMPCSMLCPLYCRVSTIRGMCIEFPGQVADLGDRPTVPFFIQPMCWLGILLFAGIVMALYALLRSNPSASAAEIEEGLDGNLCRCTGACPVCASNILLQMLPLLPVVMMFYVLLTERNRILCWQAGCFPMLHSARL